MLLDLSRELYGAVTSGNVARARELLTKYPELRSPNPTKPDPNAASLFWLRTAVTQNQVAVAEMLLEIGFDINAIELPAESTALTCAIGGSSGGANLATIHFLLTQGANATIGRTLISAINRALESEGLEIVKLLVKHGADINRVFNWLGDDNVLVTPLSYAISSGKTQIAEYLKSLGAQMPPPVPEKKKRK